MLDKDLTILNDGTYTRFNTRLNSETPSVQLTPAQPTHTTSQPPNYPHPPLANNPTPAHHLRIHRTPHPLPNHPHLTTQAGKMPQTSQWSVHYRAWSPPGKSLTTLVTRITSLYINHHQCPSYSQLVIQGSRGLENHNTYRSTLEVAMEKIKHPLICYSAHPL